LAECRVFLLLKPRDVIAIRNALGFIEVRERRSHKQFRHPDGRATTVPDHRGRDISPILLRQIAKHIDPTVDPLLTHR
jgi:predicted RNA binding protein YcfA (HicA-like mRNA interferase family)